MIPMYMYMYVHMCVHATRGADSDGKCERNHYVAQYAVYYGTSTQVLLILRTNMVQ